MKNTQQQQRRIQLETTLENMLQQIPRLHLDTNPKQWVVHFQFSVSILGSQKGEFNSNTSEEAKTLAIAILTEIFTPTVGKIFARADKRIILGHFIAVLISISVQSRNRVNMLNSITLLENICTYVQDANTLSCFLPGITGGVHKLICGKSDLKRGNNVLRAAISLWKTIIKLTISNDVSQYIDVRNFRNNNNNNNNNNNSNNNNTNNIRLLLQSYGMKVTTPINDNETIIEENKSLEQPNNNNDNDDNNTDDKKKIQVNRNHKWLYETTAKLSIVASTILKTINSLNYLQSQNRYKVHLETIELANVILIDCSNTMTATCQDDFLEIVLQFSIASISDQVVENANKTIEKVKEIYVKNKTSTLWKRIENRFDDVLRLTAKTIHTELEENVLTKRIQTLIAYVDLLQDKLEDNIFTMMKFKKKLFYISKILKPDYQNINTRIRQPLKYDNDNVIVSMEQGNNNNNNNNQNSTKNRHHAIGYYDIPFKYMKNNQSKEMLHILLSKIGTFVDGRMLLEYLTEFTMVDMNHHANTSTNTNHNNVDWRHSSPCECIFMSNSIIHGAKKELTDMFIENCLKNTVNSKLWHHQTNHIYNNNDVGNNNNNNTNLNTKLIPINSDEKRNVSGGGIRLTQQSTTLQHSEHVIVSSLYLQRLATIAENYNETFKANLLNVIYPLLEKLSDDDPIIQQNTLYCIKRICIVCGYNSINQLIEANVDYLIDNICSRLNFLNVYPTTPRVIRSVVKHTVGGVDAAYGGLLKEIVQTLLRALDTEVVQRNTFMFATSSNILTVLLYAVEDLMACLDEYIDDDDDDKQGIDDTTGKADEAISPIIKLPTSTQGLINEIIAWENILNDLNDDEDEKTNDDEEKEEEKDNDKDENKDNKPYKMERDVSQKIIRKLCIFLPESPSILQCKIIKSISFGLKVLNHNEKQLLPTVAEVWKHLISRFHMINNRLNIFQRTKHSKKDEHDNNESEYFPVIRESLLGIVQIAKLCPDFILARFSKELWPKLINILKTKVNALFTSNNSITLDELYIDGDNNNNNNAKVISSRKAKYVTRSTTHKYIYTILCSLLDLSKFAPSLLNTHVWELSTTCCKALRIIPEGFMDGDDHKNICNLLLNLYKIDSTSVFHAIIMEEQLVFKHDDKLDRISNILRTNLPELALQTIGTNTIAPIYKGNKNKKSLTLLEKLNIDPSHILQQVKHDLFVYNMLNGIPSKIIYPFAINPLETYLFHSGINMSGKTVGSLGINYAVANKPAFPYKFSINNATTDDDDGKVFNVVQKLNVGLGAVVWDCGLILAKIIEHYLAFDKYLNGKTVIDLGCGTGFCGILAQIYGAKKVVLTDIEEIVNVAKENVKVALESNFITSDTDILCQTFDWAIEQDVHTRYDMIFASDCLYDTTYYTDLINSFKKLINANGIIIIVYKLRHADREYEFFKDMERNGFSLSILTEDCIDDSLKHLRKTGLYVVVATRQC